MPSALHIWFCIILSFVSFPLVFCLNFKNHKLTLCVLLNLVPFRRRKSRKIFYLCSDHHVTYEHAARLPRVEIRSQSTMAESSVRNTDVNASSKRIKEQNRISDWDGIDSESLWIIRQSRSTTKGLVMKALSDVRNLKLDCTKECRTGETKTWRFKISRGQLQLQERAHCLSLKPEWWALYFRIKWILQSCKPVNVRLKMKLLTGLSGQKIFRPKDQHVEFAIF